MVSYAVVNDGLLEIRPKLPPNASWRFSSVENRQWSFLSKFFEFRRHHCLAHNPWSCVARCQSHLLLLTFSKNWMQISNQCVLVTCFQVLRIYVSPNYLKSEECLAHWRALALHSQLVNGHFLRMACHYCLTWGYVFNVVQVAKPSFFDSQCLNLH